ncbi:MAG: hypothetical protein IT521_02430 [Burkholderiales bacterium]|nr:hypothetical protein [Burkholderiales bacterium]
MTQFAADAFGGTSGTELSTYSSDWTKISGATQRDVFISSAGRARCGSVTGSAGYYHSVVPASADYSVSADMLVVTNASGALASTIARCTPAAATFYMFGFTVDTGWRLYKSINNTFTQLGSTVADTLTEGNTYRIETRVSGNQISGYVDGVLKIGPITDSSISAAGKPGLRLFGVTSWGDAASLHLDNWSADTLDTGYTLTLDGGQASVAGGTIGLAAARKLGMAAGSVTVAGGAVNLVYTPAGSYILTLQGGSVAVAGSSVGLRADRRLQATGGTIGISPGALALRAARSLALAGSSIAINGGVIALDWSGAAAVVPADFPVGPARIGRKAVADATKRIGGVSMRAPKRRIG